MHQGRAAGTLAVPRSWNDRCPLSIGSKNGHHLLQGTDLFSKLPTDLFVLAVLHSLLRLLKPRPRGRQPTVRLHIQNPDVARPHGRCQHLCQPLRRRAWAVRPRRQTQGGAAPWSPPPARSGSAAVAVDSS